MSQDLYYGMPWRFLPCHQEEQMALARLCPGTIWHQQVPGLVIIGSPFVTIHQQLVEVLDTLAYFRRRQREFVFRNPFKANCTYVPRSGRINVAAYTVPYISHAMASPEAGLPGSKTTEERRLQILLKHLDRLAHVRNKGNYIPMNALTLPCDDSAHYTLNGYRHKLAVHELSKTGSWEVEQTLNRHGMLLGLEPDMIRLFHTMCVITSTVKIVLLPPTEFGEIRQTPPQASSFWSMAYPLAPGIPSPCLKQEWYHLDQGVLCMCEACKTDAIWLDEIRDYTGELCATQPHRDDSRVPFETLDETIRLFIGEKPVGALYGTNERKTPDKIRELLKEMPAEWKREVWVSASCIGCIDDSDYVFLCRAILMLEYRTRADITYWKAHQDWLNENLVQLEKYLEEAGWTDSD